MKATLKLEIKQQLDKLQEEYDILYTIENANTGINVPFEVPKVTDGIKVSIPNTGFYFILCDIGKFPYIKFHMYSIRNKGSRASTTKRDLGTKSSVFSEIKSFYFGVKLHFRTLKKDLEKKM